MAQTDVLDFLKEQSEYRPNKRFTVKEIVKGLKDNNVNYGLQEGNIRRCLSRLSHYRLIDCETIGWKRTFIYKKRGKSE